MDKATPLVGSAPSLVAALDHLSLLAPVERPVLVLGERGTGKELAAERLHYLSPRWQHPLLRINCAALAEDLLDSELFGHEAGAFTGAVRTRVGRFEQADGGSLFLDELGAMSPRLQEKLLRVVEYGEFQRLGARDTRQVDVRIIGATNEDLRRAPEQGRFRPDLLDRLSFDVVALPPLRKRVGDVPELAEFFAVRMSAELGWELFPGFSEGALADVIFGDVNPSARLPTTFPRRLQDNPAFINYPGENGKVHYGEGVFVGYRYYDAKEIAPLFPFGYGLSYTTFAYDNLRLNGAEFSPGDEIVVQVDVTNTGSVAGQEVVQLYVQDEEARLPRPLQELKAFAKVALEPGETKTVALTLDQQSLAYYDTAVGGWFTEPGQFTVRVGSSSRDIHVQGDFTWVDETAVIIETDPDPRQLSTVAT